MHSVGGEWSDGMAIYDAILCQNLMLQLLLMVKQSL